MIVASDITNAFPELNAVASSTFTWAIAEAYAELDTATLGVDLDRAATFLAAHYAAMATAGIAKGFVTEMHVGPVGRQMMFPSGYEPDDYSLTSYGIIYRRFIRKAIDYWIVG